MQCAAMALMARSCGFIPGLLVKNPSFYHWGSFEISLEMSNGRKQNPQRSFHEILLGLSGFLQSSTGLLNSTVIINQHSILLGSIVPNQSLTNRVERSHCSIEFTQYDASIL